MKNENLKFEDAMLELEDIVKKLESGELSLEDSISAYENAMKLVNLCFKKLDSAEQKVKILTEKSDGSITDKPFIKDNEDL